QQDEPPPTFVVVQPGVQGDGALECMEAADELREHGQRRGEQAAAKAVRLDALRRDRRLVGQARHPWAPGDEAALLEDRRTISWWLGRGPAGEPCELRVGVRQACARLAPFIHQSV